jgi:hypothetical protein
MEYNDRFDPASNNDYDNDAAKEIESFKKLDRGYCKIYRNVIQANGKMKKTKIEMYSSGDTGSNIRDAETGVYYKGIVGTIDEDAYFKVGMSTGQCKSKNGCNTLFYLSPSHYINHQHVTINDSEIETWNALVQKWEDKQTII